MNSKDLRIFLFTFLICLVVIPFPSPKMIFAQESDPESTIEMGDWYVKYRVSNSDGLIVPVAKYKGQTVVKRLSLPEILVPYPDGSDFVGFVDVIGKPPYAGFPAQGPTLLTPISDGFMIKQLFHPIDWAPDASCSYKYEQFYRFHDDGRIDVRLKMYGPGCFDVFGSRGTYYPYWRLDMNVGSTFTSRLDEWNGSSWALKSTEGRFVDNGNTDPFDSNSFKWRERSATKTYNYHIGYFDSHGIGNVNFWGLLFHVHTEGDIDLAVQSNPANQSSWTLPSNWVIYPTESILDQNIVEWYRVEALQKDASQADACQNTSPCTRGPFLTPIGY